MQSLLIVVDTMVVLAAMLGDRDGPSAAVVDATATGDVRLAVSDDQLRELAPLWATKESKTPLVVRFERSRSL